MRLPSRQYDASMKITDNPNTYISVWLDEGVLAFIEYTMDFRTIETLYLIKEENKKWLYNNNTYGNNWFSITNTDVIKVINKAVDISIEKELLG